MDREPTSCIAEITGYRFAQITADRRGPTWQRRDSKVLHQRTAAAVSHATMSACRHGSFPLLQLGATPLPARQVRPSRPFCQCGTRSAHKHMLDSGRSLVLNARKHMGICDESEVVE